MTVGLTACSADQPGTLAAADPPITELGPVTVTPDDLRYADLVRGINHRFVGQPEYVRVVGSTQQVVQAVDEAVGAGKRLAVRSGGHCAESFVADPAVQVVIDLSAMTGVSYDPQRNAFAIQAGATLDQVYRTLFKGWGVTIPAGACPTVGVGGHLAGGGYGPLSRRYGSVVDYLDGVEVVVVDQDGTASSIIATREDDDPNRELWWAHTGGGGGNFGVVTRYWLRTLVATGTDPARLLPAPPAQVMISSVAWSWEGMDQRSFNRLLRNHGAWHERNSAPDSPATGLYSVLALTHQQAGALGLFTQVDATTPDARRLLDDYVAAVTEGVGVTPLVSEPRVLPWLHATVWPGDREGGDLTTRRYKLKGAYLRKGFTDRQITAAYTHLTRGAYDNPNAVMLLIAYGGAVNAVPPSATALAQRDSVLKLACETFWATPEEDATNLAWIRGLYRDLYADTGGVPVPDSVSDGSYVNYPDTDLADARWNTSGVPWHTLYYKDNYPRLQQAKARWDPRNVFRHALSVQPPG